jgi:hypothetical protein
MEDVMHRTTVMLPVDLKQRAEKRARNLGVSLGTLVRTSLERALEEPASASAPDPLLASQAVFTGATPSDLSSGHDDWLYGEAE